MTRELARLARNPDRPPRRVGALVVLLLVVVAAGGAVVAVGEALDEVRPERDVTATAVPLVPAPAAAPRSWATTPSVAPQAPTSGPVEPVAVAASPPLDTLGVVDGLSLFVPADQPVLVSYHEASRTGAMPIAPSGTVTFNENPTRAYDEVGGDGPRYHVQVSRGRRQGPTSAVDVVLAEGQRVLAPVTGRVLEARRYRLYGSHDDVRVVLAPDDDRSLRVVLIHLEDVVVRSGDRVVAGEVVAGGARRFPFSSVVDTATAPTQHGHVHVEVKAAATRGSSPPRAAP